ncbi:hypothetical protein VTO42DRAFT_3286 [Malbranchea cinnamomea]
MSTEDPTLHLPRILCLHGGGVNAEVFYIQCRALRHYLSSKFRFCFAEGPFFCDAGPGVLPVYKDYGPFRRWMRWLPEHPVIDPESVATEIDYSIQSAMEEDNRKGATGEWVGVLGFSQGAKVAAGLLFRQQVRSEKLGPENAGSKFRFGIILAGRAPLVALDPALMTSPALLSASETSDEFSGWDYLSQTENRDHILRLPTVHVHGLRDPGLPLHRQLLERYCEKGTTRLVEWDGGHRVPIKTHDVEAVVKQIIEVAVETGVL